MTSKIDNVIQQAEQQCQSTGGRLTQKRRLILEILLENDQPQSAYEISDLYQQKSGEKIPAMSVYRMLDFLMEKGFKPMPGADGWQLSNVNVLASAAHAASLEIFEGVGMNALRAKSLKLTAFLEFIIDELNKEYGGFEIITPRDPEQRGAQLSIFFHKNGKALFDYLVQNGVIGDWREPNVIRIAPVPLYNSFEDVYHFGRLLKEALDKQ